MDFKPPKKRELEWSTKNMPLTSKCTIWLRAPLENLLTMLPFHCNIGESFSPIPIPISTNRLLPSLVQVPNRIHNDGSIYIDFRKLNATIRKDHYPLPFIEPNQGQFEENVMEETPPHVVGTSEA
ncbi:hypothetical protein COP1_006946 [Malus domestica]